MKLEGKRQLASRTLNVGSNRIIFNSTRLTEIKEAITKQDIKDLHSSGAISIKEKFGRRVVKRRKTRRRKGSVKKKVNNGKKVYVTLTRKLRSFLANHKRRGKITNEEEKDLRKEVRTSNFRSLSHLKERLGEKNA